MAFQSGRVNLLYRFASQPSGSAPGTPPSSTDYTPFGPAYQAGLDRIHAAYPKTGGGTRAIKPGDTINAYDINGMLICTNNLFWHRHLYTDYYQLSTYTGPAPPNCWYTPSPPDNVQYALGAASTRADQTTSYGGYEVGGYYTITNLFAGVSQNEKITTNHMNDLRLDIFRWAFHKHTLSDQTSPVA